MNNYLLSIDPSIKNTGFTLWENKKPVLVKSCSFKNKNKDFINITDVLYEYYYLRNLRINIFYEHLNLIIERGTFHSKNGIGYETQEHLRGFIAGQFNKLLTKDMLISPSKWKSWYRLNFNIDDNFLIKWTKEISIKLAKQVIQEQNWNITISNHDEADSLLIGWYYLNKENK
ncbi:hypothetical protein [Spiroplasma endosymbiont of Colias croceus]|uniref:hypothetical protein n=1 Tax=Spiroplasma endosymbiont of Colias croceus TaxID=3066310 RepID=UPI0030CC90C2